jgi:uncharacterized damage-inducible protein DinB
MRESEVLKQMYRVNRTVRERFLETLSSMSREELLCDRGASFPSLLDIFVHVLDGYRFWIMHVMTNSTGSFAELRGKIVDARQLRDLEKEVDAKVVSFIEGLSEESVDRQVKSPWEEGFLRVGDVCWHVIDEELQHRGELNALLWQINIEPPHATYEDWLNARATSR